MLTPCTARLAPRGPDQQPGLSFPCGFQPRSWILLHASSSRIVLPRHVAPRHPLQVINGHRYRLQDCSRTKCRNKSLFCSPLLYLGLFVHRTKRSASTEAELSTVYISGEVKKNQVSQPWQFYGKILLFLYTNAPHPRRVM